MRKLIGHAFVDSGSVWIGDPCYVIGGDASHGFEDWKEYCANLSKIGHWDSDDNYCQPAGDGIGFHVQTYWGDGSYPVYAEVDDRGIKSVHIYFDDEGTS